MPLRSRLLKIPELKTRYLQNVKVIASQLDWKQIGGLVSETRKLIAADVQRDTKKLTSWEDFEIAMSDKPTEGAASLRNFFDKRRAYLLSYSPIQKLPEPTPVINKKELATSRNTVFTKDSPVVINELMASNGKTVRNGNGKFSDWIELHNRSKKTVDLSNVFLSDSPHEPRKWQFPKGVRIGPGEYLIVWADGDAKANGLHANFKLSKDGENVWLCKESKGELQIWDQVRFGPQKDDVSIGRTSKSTFTSLPKPTLGKPNE